MNIPEGIRCSHCRNDRKDMIEIHKINHFTTVNGLKTEIIYHCEVCSKEFKYESNPWPDKTNIR